MRRTTGIVPLLAACALAACTASGVDPTTLHAQGAGARGDVDRLAYPPRVSGTLAQDFSRGTFPLATNSNIAGAIVSRDAARGATRIRWADAARGQMSGIRAEGTWNFNSSDLFAVDLGFDPGQQFTSVAVYLAFDSVGFSNYAAIDLPGAAWPKPSRLTIPFTRSAMRIVGTPAWSAVRRIEIRLYRTASSSGPNAFYVYGFWSHVRARAKVLLTFDDGNETAYTEAFPRMGAAGMRGTLYVNGATVGGPGSLSLAELRELDSAGWDVASHTWDHTRLAERPVGPGSRGIVRSGSTATAALAPSSYGHGLRPGDTFLLRDCEEAGWNGVHAVDLTPDPYTWKFTVPTSLNEDAGSRCAVVLPTTPSEAEIRETVGRNKAWLVQNGFTRAIEHVAYPYGFVDSAAIAVLEENGYQTGRDSVAWPFGTNDCSVPTLTGINQPFELGVRGIGAPATAAVILAIVDTAIAKGNTVILLGHQLVTGEARSGTETSVLQFQALIDGLRERRDAELLDVVTISEWYGR